MSSFTVDPQQMDTVENGVDIWLCRVEPPKLVTSAPTHRHRCVLTCQTPQTAKCMFRARE